MAHESQLSQRLVVYLRSLFIQLCSQALYGNAGHEPAVKYIPNQSNVIVLGKVCIQEDINPWPYRVADTQEHT